MRSLQPRARAFPLCMSCSGVNNCFLILFAQCFSHMCLVSYDHVCLPDLTVQSLAQYRPGDSLRCYYVSCNVRCTGQNLKSLLHSPIIALVGGNTCKTFSADGSISNNFLYAASGFDKVADKIDWEEIEHDRYTF